MGWDGMNLFLLVFGLGTWRTESSHIKHILLRYGMTPSVQNERTSHFAPSDARLLPRELLLPSGAHLALFPVTSEQARRAGTGARRRNSAAGLRRQAEREGGPPRGYAASRRSHAPPAGSGPAPPRDSVVTMRAPAPPLGCVAGQGPRLSFTALGLRRSSRPTSRAAGETAAAPRGGCRKAADGA